MHLNLTIGATTNLAALRVVFQKSYPVSFVGIAKSETGSTSVFSSSQSTPGQTISMLPLYFHDYLFFCQTATILCTMKFPRMRKFLQPLSLLLSRYGILGDKSRFVTKQIQLLLGNQCGRFQHFNLFNKRAKDAELLLNTNSINNRPHQDCWFRWVTVNC